MSRHRHRAAGERMARCRTIQDFPNWSHGGVYRKVLSGQTKEWSVGSWNGLHGRSAMPRLGTLKTKDLEQIQGSGRSHLSLVKPYPWIRLAFQNYASPFETAATAPSPAAVTKPSTGPPTKRPHVAQACGLLYFVSDMPQGVLQVRWRSSRFRFPRTDGSDNR